MRRFSSVAVACAIAIGAASAQADTQLVMFRHAEKPNPGLGQLSCQGLNRALALPRVLLSRYGKPNALYAPDPGAKKDDDGTPYNYLRPLATIEPTAIRAGLPVDTHLAWDDMDHLEQELLSPAHDGQTLFVAWEHHVLEDLARDILKRRGGDADQVAKWPGGRLRHDLRHHGEERRRRSLEDGQGRPGQSKHRVSAWLRRLILACLTNRFD